MIKIKNMNDTESENLKFVVLHINDTQVRLLEKFFEKIGIYYYTIEDNVKRAIDKSIKHQQTKVWPGSDALVTFPLGDKKVDEFLIKLKTFRMILPSEFVSVYASKSFFFLNSTKSTKVSLTNSSLPLKSNL